MSFDPLFAAGTTITIHALAAIFAFILGVLQLLRPKGGSVHRVLGYIWCALMMIVALTSLWIHELQIIGSFSPIHILSIVVIVSVPLAVMSARTGNIKRHRHLMLSLFAFALVTTGLFTLLPNRVMYQVIWP